MMLTRLLLIVIIISCETLSKGFMKLPNFSLKRSLNVMLSSTCFYDGDDEKYNNKYNSKSDLDGVIDGSNYILYTLIWFDCYDCNKLLQDVKEAGKEVLYINGSYYFFDEKDATNSPLFYKGDYLIAMDLFSIYEELFYDIMFSNMSTY